MADLPTNYLDDILAQSMNGKRKFRITRPDGTFEEVIIEDISEYSQTGSTFGAGDINRTNQAVNEKFDSKDVVDPMLTTEPGFAADAYKTKLQFDEQNKKGQEYLNVVENDYIRTDGTLLLKTCGNCAILNIELTTKADIPAWTKITLGKTAIPFGNLSNTTIEADNGSVAILSIDSSGNISVMSTYNTVGNSSVFRASLPFLLN